MRSWPLAFASVTMLSAAAVMACSQFDAADTPAPAEEAAAPLLEGGAGGDTGTVADAAEDSDVQRCPDLFCEDWDRPNAFQGWTPEVTAGNSFGVAASTRSAPQAFRSGLAGGTNGGLSSAYIVRYLSLPAGTKRVTLHLDAKYGLPNVITSVAQLVFDGKGVGVLIQDSNLLVSYNVSGDDADGTGLIVLPLSTGEWHSIELEVALGSPGALRLVVDGSAPSAISDLRALTFVKPTRLVVGLGSSYGPKPNELLVDRLRVAAQ